MKVETRPAEIDGHRLHRLLLSPTGNIRGGLVFFHGQGDFIDRYPDILEPFVLAGYQCLLTDLPGHGRSPGKRGHVPGLPFVEHLLTDSISHLTGPTLIAGHSMGGLLALHFFLRQPCQFAAAWLSSPLLRVIDRAAPWLRALLPLLSKVAPRLTVGTGVKREQCEAPLDDSSHPEPDHEALYHSRISLSWGSDLCEASDTVWQRAERLGGADLPLLFTQGQDDEICPPEILREFLQLSGSTRHQLHLIAQARHEPFRDPTREVLLAILQKWIESELTSQTPLPQSPPA